MNLTRIAGAACWLVGAAGCTAPAGDVGDLPGANGGQALGPDGPVTLTITAPPSGSHVRGDVALQAAVTGAIPEVTLLIDEVPVANLEDPFSHLLHIDGLAEGIHRLRLRAVVAGTLLRSAPVDLDVDRTRPAVSTQSPDGEGGAGAVVVTFSEPIAAATIDGSSVRLSDGSGAPLASSLELSEAGRRLTVTAAAPPAPPDRPVLALSNGITDLAGNALLPVENGWFHSTWPRRGGPFGAAAARPSLALGPAPFVAYEAFDGVTTHVEVSLGVGGGGWVGLGGVLDAHPVRATVFGAQAPVVAVDEGGNPWVAWTEPEPATGFTRVQVSRWSNGGWHLLAAPPERGGLFSQSPVLAVSDGTVFLAWTESQLGNNHVFVSSYDPLTDSWLPLGAELDAAGAAGSQPALVTPAGEAPLVAFSEQSGVAWALRVRRWDGAAWQTLGGSLQIDGAAPVVAKSIAADGAEPVVAWIETGLARDAAFVKRWDETGGSWQAVGGRLNHDPDDSARAVAVAVSSTGDIVAAWQADFRTTARLYVKRWNGAVWGTIGGRLNPEAAAAAPSLALDAAGAAQVAYVEGEQIVVRAEAPAATPPAGLRQRLANPSCRFALEADDPAIPQTLADTRCFADVPSRTLIAAAVPYALQSRLWSDGTLKERAMVLPDGGTIDYFPQGSWELPPDTVLIKSFLLERVTGDPSTVFPVETRFFTRGADGLWRGYSYRWNDEGSEATLLDAQPHRFDYEVISGTATVNMSHYFPGRSECAYCHSGTRKARGLQTAQMNREYDFGDAVDNQLRAWNAIGLFGSTFTATPIDQLPQLPDPADRSRGAEERVRSYMHANCSHCHPANIPALNLTFETDLADTGLCDATAIPGFGSLRVAPGDPQASAIFRRMSVRGPSSGQMPCIGTDRTDPLALEVVEQWITALSVCP